MQIVISGQTESYRAFILDRFLGRFFLITLALFLFTYPIIHADFLYRDDIARVLSDGPLCSWFNDGRPLTVALMDLLGMGELTDLAPLPQLLWIPFLAAVLANISQRFSFHYIPAIFALSFVVVQPFYLENISYRYEALMMGLAISFALLPFILPAIFTKCSSYKIWLLSTFVLFLTSNFYQPALNIFGSFACFICLLIFCREASFQKSFKQFLLYITSLLTAMLFYVVELRFIHCWLLKTGGSATLPPPARHGEITFRPYKIFQNFPDYFQVIKTGAFQGTQAHLLSFILGCGLVCLAASLFVAFKRSDKIFNWPAFFFIPLLIFGLFAFILGPELFLKWPIFQPRVLIGFGGFSAALLCFLCGVGLERFPLKYFGYSLCIVAFCSEILLSLSYGNAMKWQFRQEDSLADMMIEDAEELYTPEVKFFATNGQEPIARRSERTFMAFPVVRKMMFLHMGNRRQTQNKWTQISWQHQWIQRGAPEANNYNDELGEYTMWPFFLWDFFNAKGGLPHDLRLGWQEGEDMNVFYPAQGIGKSFGGCHVDARKEHPYFDTYRMGPNLVFDYAKTCRGK